MVNVFSSNAKMRFLELLSSLSSEEMPSFVIWLDFKLAVYKANMQGPVEDDDLLLTTYPKWIGDALQLQLQSLLGANMSHKKSCSEASECSSPRIPSQCSPSPSDTVKDRISASLDPDIDKSFNGIDHEIKLESTMYPDVNDCGTFSGEEYSVEMKNIDLSQSFLGDHITNSINYDGMSQANLSGERLGDANSPGFSDRCFKCPECDRCFKSGYDLKEHIPRAHGHDGVFSRPDSSDPSGKVIWSCYYCAKPYSDLYKVWQHVETVHCGSLFFCHVCGKGLRHQGNLARHVKAFHSSIKP